MFAKNLYAHLLFHTIMISTVPFVWYNGLKHFLRVYSSFLQIFVPKNTPNIRHNKIKTVGNGRYQVDRSKIAKKRWMSFMDVPKTKTKSRKFTEGHEWHFFENCSNLLRDKNCFSDQEFTLIQRFQRDSATFRDKWTEVSSFSRD